MTDKEYKFIEEWTEDLYGLPCVSCGHPLYGTVDSYVHDGGVPLDGTGIKYWLYVTCADCGYENSWWKLIQRKEVKGMMKKVEIEVSACDVCGRTILSGGLTTYEDGTTVCNEHLRPGGVPIG